MKRSGKLMSNTEERQRKFIPELILDCLHEHGVDFITELPTGMDTSVDDVIAYCTTVADELHRGTFDFENLINSALSTGYDRRYFKARDEREMYKAEFLTAFCTGMQYFGVSDWTAFRILVVGIGTGSEAKILFREVSHLTIVDIASKSLGKAKEILPQAYAYETSAGKLEKIPSDTVDIYISLRTYMSTYFDIPAAIQEASRVLVSGGILVLSVACGILDSEGKYSYGLHNPHTGEFERDRPQKFVNRIVNHLRNSYFDIVHIETTPTEIFIFSTNIGKC